MSGAATRLVVRQIRIESIVVTPRLRELSIPRVNALAESMRQSGLIHPITIRRQNGSYTPELVAGAHRLEAAKRLGWETISCALAPSEDDDRAALIEIDENLVRNELSPAEQAIHIDRRKEIYERLYPETKHGTAGNGRKKSSQVENSTPAPRFTVDAAAKTGRSVASVARDATRAKAIPQIADVVGTSLDKGEELDALAKLAPDKQAEIIGRAKAGERVRAKLEVKKVKRAEKEAALAERTKAESEKLGTKVYGVILIDPPWRFEPWSRESGLDRAADNHYPTMTFEEIAERRPPAAQNCVIFLWTTGPMAHLAHKLLDVWELEYRAQLIWAKDRTAHGYWFRSKHEVLLVAVKGDVPAPAPGEQFDSVIEAAVRRHSEKPAIFHEIIEKLFQNVPKCEMYARGALREGWDPWGNEAPLDIDPGDAA